MVLTLLWAFDCCPKRSILLCYNEIMSYPIHVYDSSTVGKPVLCIGHGNGFPPLAYAPFAKALGEGYHAVCLPARPWWGEQDPHQFDSWQILADDLLAGIQAHCLAPVIGVGHSMSGVALVMAAVKCPQLFRAIVLLDPVFLPPLYLAAAQLAQWLGLQPNLRMVQGALKRQRNWASQEEAYQRFRGRSLFARCSDELVRLYTQGMTRQNGHGIELAYPPEWEAQIFSVAPLGEWDFLPELTVSTLVIAGSESDVFTARSIKVWRSKRPDVPVIVVPDSGHLVPFEQPDTVASHVLDFLVALPN